MSRTKKASKAPKKRLATCCVCGCQYDPFEYFDLTIDEPLWSGKIPKHLDENSVPDSLKADFDQFVDIAIACNHGHYGPEHVGDKYTIYRLDNGAPPLVLKPKCEIEEL